MAGKKREIVIVDGVLCAVCKICGIPKPLDAEHFFRAENHGRGIRFFGTCKVCRAPLSKAYQEKNKERRSRNGKESYRKKRLSVLQHYSHSEQPFCECCGERHIEFLAIDHINGGGNRLRKAQGSAGTRTFMWLLKNGFPEGFRVLCNNCNMSLGFYGYCPHQKEGANAVK